MLASRFIASLVLINLLLRQLRRENLQPRLQRLFSLSVPPLELFVVLQKLLIVTLAAAIPRSFPILFQIRALRLGRLVSLLDRTTSILHRRRIPLLRVPLRRRLLRSRGRRQLFQIRNPLLVPLHRSIVPPQTALGPLLLEIELALARARVLGEDDPGDFILDEGVQIGLEQLRVVQHADADVGRDGRAVARGPELDAAGGARGREPVLARFVGLLCEFGRDGAFGRDVLGFDGHEARVHGARVLLAVGAVARGAE